MSIIGKTSAGYAGRVQARAGRTEAKGGPHPEALLKAAGHSDPEEQGIYRGCSAPHSAMPTVAVALSAHFCTVSDYSKNS